MRDVVIVGAARTPIASFLGALAPVSAPKLGSVAIQAALSRAGVAPADVELVQMGCVLPAGQGQAPARQAALGAGLPQGVPCVTINKVCGSGLETVLSAARSIAVGDVDIAVAGGMESMSNVPHLLRGLRGGVKRGALDTVDGMTHDGLWDVYTKQHMGHRLGYAQGNLSVGDRRQTYAEKGWGELEYQVTVPWKLEDGNLEGVWSITSNRAPGQTGSSSQLAGEALSRGYETDLALARKWWSVFWAHSSIGLPDPVLERQWYLEQYKFGCVARPGAPPITLQAIWTTDNGNLPPWKGDIHNDLNIQLSYWPAYTGNHLAEAEGMVRCQLA